RSNVAPGREYLCASDSKPSSHPAKALVEDGLAPEPRDLSSASGSWGDGTATSTASASDASSHALVWCEPGIEPRTKRSERSSCVGSHEGSGAAASHPTSARY